MPSSWTGTRWKYIHSVGTTGKVKFVPNSAAKGFSGIFKGANYGMIRLSSAAEPVNGGLMN